MIYKDDEYCRSHIYMERWKRYEAAYIEWRNMHAPDPHRGRGLFSMCNSVVDNGMLDHPLYETAFLMLRSLYRYEVAQGVLSEISERYSRMDRRRPLSKTAFLRVEV